MASVTEAIKQGTVMGSGGIDFAVKIDQAMSDGKRLVCSGAFITPHVVLTAAHCTRNYDYGSVITPTTDTVIRYGTSFATSQKIAGDEKVGWRELGSTDIGLYRVANAASLSVQPKVYRSCSTVNLVGQDIVVYGRMADGAQAPAAEYRSRSRTVRGVASGIGANGNYLQIDSTTDGGDSGGPWVYGGDKVVAVTHSGSSSDYGSRFCDVAKEIETQVTDWGDTLAYVEDSAASGSDGGSGAGRGGAGGQAGTSVSPSSGVGGARAGAAGGARAGSAGRAGGTDGPDSGAAGGRAAGASAGGSTASRAGAGGATAGAGGQGGTAGSPSSAGRSRGTGGASGSGAGGAAGIADEGSERAGAGGSSAAVAGGGSTAKGGTGGGGAKAGTSGSSSATGTGGGGRESAPETATIPSEPAPGGCACATPARTGHDRFAASAVLMALVGLVAARRAPRQPLQQRRRSSGRVRA